MNSEMANSRSQIVFPTDIFRNLTLGAPDHQDSRFIFNFNMPKLVLSTFIHDERRFRNVPSKAAFSR